MDSTLPKPATPENTPAVVAEKRDLLARLLGRLAHEIRNPLSSLDIHVQLLAEDLANAPPQMGQKVAGRLEIIRGELGRLEGIVKRFLRLASPSTLELERVDLPKIVDHVCRLLGPEAAARHVEISAELNPNLTTLEADGVQLTQALLNLLINALQAVDQKGCIRLRTGPDSADGFLRIDVQDSGPGVPPEKLSSVFEPYFTTKEEGSGLGLWIAQQIAGAHGGSLQVANTAEGGAVFSLCLPVSQENRARG